MFKCEQCGRITKAGEKQTKKIIETRNKTYINEDRNGNKKKTEGAEIVKEINLCEECASKEANYEKII